MFELTRIAPCDCGVELGYSEIDRDFNVEAEIRACGNGKPVSFHSQVINDSMLLIKGLTNAVEYEVRLTVLDQYNRVREKSCFRKFICGYLPGKAIAYRHPFDQSVFPEGLFLGTPSICKRVDGALLASHDLFFWDPHHNYDDVDYSKEDISDMRVSHVYVSYDNGKNWQFLSKINGCMYGKLFEHKGNIYMYARVSHGKNNVETGDLGIFQSTNGGISWSEPTVIAYAQKEGDQFHKSSTPIVKANGRLWTSFDSPVNGVSGRGFGVISISEDADLMRRENWTVSNVCYYDESWNGATEGVWNYMMEEANAVLASDGKLRIIARYNEIEYAAGSWFSEKQDRSPRAVMMTYDMNAPEKAPVFECFIPFIGSLSKFVINYDVKTGMYYSIVNRVTRKTEGRAQRQVVTLTRSGDLIHWEMVRDLINLADAQWPENFVESGFAYLDWLFDGEDIIAVSRTAMHGAISFHDNNYLTFHRFRMYNDDIYR